MLREDSVERMLQLALKRLPQAMCGKGKRCAPLTPEEKSKPPLSIEQARSAMTAGVLSGTAQHCQLDWKKRVFLPFMAYHRYKLKLSGRQLALLNILHGSMQDYVRTGFKRTKEKCSPKMRADLEKKIAKP
jgi:hypothetical protein